MPRPHRAVRLTATVLLAAAAPVVLGALPLPAASASSSPLVRLAELAAGKPVRTIEYQKFERLAGSRLSPDGRWLAWGVSRADGESAVHLRDLEAGDAEDAVTTWDNGGRPDFSPDGRWFMLIEGVSRDEREALEKRRQPVPSTLVLRDVTTGEDERIERIASASFSADGAYLLLRRQGGSGIVVRELDGGTHTTIAGVTTSEWSDEGSLLAIVIEPGTDEDRSLQIFDPADGRIRPLDSGGDGYAGLVWREDAFDLAVMRKHEFETGEDETYVVHAWRGLDGEASHVAWDHLDETVGIRDRRVVTWAGLRWSPDGERLAFGTDPWEKKPAELVKAEAEAEADAEADEAAKDAAPAAAPADGKARGGDEKKADEPKTMRETLEEAAGVDVWHAEDVRIIPLQKRRAAGDRRRNDLGMLHLDAADGPMFVLLGDEETDRLLVTEPMNHAIALVDTAYEELQRFGPTLYDVHHVDIATGERTRLARGVKYAYGTSPDGNTLLWQRDGHLLATDLPTQTTVNLTEDLPHSVINDRISTLTDEKPVWGLGDWTQDSESLVVYDEYDAWMVARDGSSTTRLTDGRGDRIRYRLTEARGEDDDAEPHLDPAAPMHFSMYGDRSKKRGVARLDADGEFTILRWEDRQLGGLIRARDAEVYAWTEEAFDLPPRLMVAGDDLTPGEPTATTNEWLADRAWGRAELIDFVNTRGEDMQATLYYPAGYVPGKKYPMIVYIYEELTQNIHRFVTPAETSPYNTATFTSEGYFVLQPDITYRAQEPGVSSGECVVPAVEAVVDMGLVDADRVGIMGHSWGAYQTAWLVTHTDTFAAGVAGAPLTNMISMSMSIYWNSGQTDAWIFHESQGRMDRPFWDDLDTYVRNSPIFKVDEMDTPLLVAFGDEDGAVDWQQGVEMYNAARLAGKQFVMLVYEGENHGLRREPNRVDYHYRVREWFDHYLKGAPADAWITEGVDVLDRERELEESGKKAVGGPGGGTRPGTARSR
jgi:dipeptidyl aminopeptidase/acylaminoacyl peptidase